jgi:hypothetical protein
MTDTVTTETSTLDISTASIRISMTRVRPSTEVAWPDNTTLNNHLISTYNNDGKRWCQFTDSEDGLTKTSVAYWIDWLTWQNVNINDVLMMEHDLVTAPAYNASAGITRTTVKEIKISGEWHTMPAIDSGSVAIKLLRLQELKGS